MGKVVNKISNSSYMVHERPEGLQHENKYLLITRTQCLAHFTRWRRLYLRVVSAKFGLRDALASQTRSDKFR